MQKEPREEVDLPPLENGAGLAQVRVRKRKESGTPRFPGNEKSWGGFGPAPGGRRKKGRQPGPGRDQKEARGVRNLKSVSRDSSRKIDLREGPVYAIKETGRPESRSFAFPRREKRVASGGAGEGKRKNTQKISRRLHRKRCTSEGAPGGGDTPEAHRCYRLGNPSYVRG